MQFLRISLLMFLINKTNNFRGNQKPEVLKTLKLAIMKCFHLQNKTNKTQLPSDKQNYKKNEI